MAIPTGLTVNCVIIESDGMNELYESVKPKGSLEDLSSKEIIEIIKEAGITGMGELDFQPMLNFHLLLTRRLILFLSMEQSVNPI